MSKLMRSTALPSFRSMMEDFWNTENWFRTPLFNGENLPAVNIKENDKNFEIEVAAPGFEKKDFKVDIAEGVLTISAESKNEIKEDKENYTRREFSFSSFTRSFTLPETAKQENITAKYENGLLRLTLQKSKKPELQRKQVAIQ